MQKPAQLRLVSDDPETARLSDFELFWECYPRRVGKLDAMRAWAQTAGQRPDIEQIIAAVEQHARSSQWTRDGAAYIPHPATWLRRGGWEDEIE